MRSQPTGKGISLRSLTEGSTRKNILSNYVGQGAAVAVPLLALPHYLSMLGTSNWGLVSLSVLIQSLMSLFGTGMNQAIVREAALRHGEAPEQRENVAGLLMGLERIYWVMGIVCTVIVIALFPWLVQLLIKPATAESGTSIIVLAGLMFMAQFAASPYKAILYGTGRQVQSNGIMLVWLLVRHALALLASHQYGTAVAYLAVTIGCMALELATYRANTWKWLAVDKIRLKTDPASIKAIIKATGPLTLSVVISLLAMQVDKWAVATLLSTDVLGMYTIATTLGLGILNLFLPVAKAYQPVIIQLAATTGSLRALNIKLLKLFFVGALVVIAGHAFLGEFLLHAWLRNEAFADGIFPALGILLVGSSLNAMYNIGYMNWLAHGETRKILRANVVSLVTVLAVVPFTTNQYGMAGAAFGWLLSNFICFLLSLDWLLDRPRHATTR